MSLRPALPLLLALLLAGCGGGGDDGGVGTPAVDATVVPDVATAANGTCVLDESRAPVVAACEDLTARLNSAPGEVVVVSVTRQQWPDSCLGAAEPDEACAQVITPGYEVVLKLISIPSAYTYHTDEGTNVRLASIDLRFSDRVELRLGEPQRVVRGFEPVAFDFAPDGRLFFTERRRGEIRAVDLASFDRSAIASFGELFAEVDTFVGSECGLLGIAVDPEFSTNHYLYVYVTQPVPDRAEVGQPRVIRYTDVDGTGSDPTVIVGDLPLTNSRDCAHVGGNLHFGPDGYMYLSLGNFERPQTAANLGSPLGKILRIDQSDGSAAPDNPFASNPAADKRIFAYGLRNPWDFAFHPQTGAIYGPDNGPGNCDELNIIEAGLDYGVPGSLVSGDAPSCLGLGGVDPIYLFARPETRPEQFASNVAPAGVAFVSGHFYPSLGEGLLVCEFATKTLRHLHFVGTDQDQVGNDVVLASDCQFNVGTDSGGIIYYSNAEGIYRLPPEGAPAP